MNLIKQSVGLLLVLLLAAATPALAQGPDYHIEAYTVAGGGGESSGGAYALGGTAGQAEANPVDLSGSGYDLWPGFWRVSGSGGPVTLYLPVIVKNYVSAPDLVITGLNVEGGLTVTVKNQGNAAVTDAFWLDVYFNPSLPPQLNQPWPTIAPAGGSLTLTVGDTYYFPQYSSDSFPVGVPVYGYVDSVDYDTSYGAVWESDEGNNLFGPVVSAGGNEAATVGSRDSAPVSAGLPSR